MNLNDIVKSLKLDVRSGRDALNTEVRGGYVSDLMSDVIAHGREGDLWVTMQTHQNTIAVASLKELAGIIIVNGREPEADTLAKAGAENVALFVSALPAFEVAGRLYKMGLTGMRT